VAPGRLGVVLDRRPAPEAVAARRQTDEVLAALARRAGWKELPGTAVELARLEALFPGRATVLRRAAAGEPQLDELRAAGRLKEFRYLHFATHGELNDHRSFESALILAGTDRPADALERVQAEQLVFDGRLTANEVLREWQLNADMVTLSACETALGRVGGGDGLLGFAQAFLTAGSRSVCVSLWKVDDAATALLMDRFYRNLLGRRPGLAGPMRKAEALAEAKRWLRDLPADEAVRLTADLAGGVARGKDEPALKLVVPNDPGSGRKPFAHPRYWAAFVLFGDPE
jgi:CHAT domain-containing protein